jgi:DNA-binding beta-propeller fold protein YncE
MGSRAPLVLLLLAALPAAAQLRLEKSIPLPGVEGRIDHLAADVAGRRLFVAALGNNTLEVLDLRAGKRSASVAGLREPQGVAFIPALNRIFVANGGDGKCRIFDASTLKPAGQLDFSSDADNLRYDAARNVLYAGYGEGALGIADPGSGQVTGSIALGAHPESFQLEQAGPRIFVNVPNARHIAVIDRERRTVTAAWPVTAAAANFPMALDEAGRRLFAGCRRPARVLIFDTATGRMGASFACVGDTDDLFYDAARKRLYVSGGAGALEVFGDGGAGGFRLLQKLQTPAGARTSLYVPAFNRLFLAVPHRGNQRAEVRVYVVE